MTLEDLYAIIVTAPPTLSECRDFYVRHFDFAVAFESSWFVLLQSPGEIPRSLAFMSSDHPSAPPGPETYGGTGMCVEIQVDDAAAAHARASTTGLEIELSLRDEPFGQRRFGFHDPAGVWVDVVEQIAPQAGYWERYMVPERPATASD